MNFSRKIIAAAATLITLFLPFSVKIHAQNTKSQTRKPTVLFVGTYHMANPGRDLVNTKVDDVLVPKKQREIEEFVKLLKKFRPTKVALEFQPEASKVLHQYTDYLTGKYELTRNEIDQIGFRLAKEMNHPQVYGIDRAGTFDFGKVVASAKANNQTSIIEELMKYPQTIIAEFNDLQKTATVTQLHRYQNQPRLIEESHGFYLQLLRVGKEKDYASAELLRDWYERNLKIFANIIRITDSPNERIIVLIGAGHLKLLKEFTKQSNLYTVESTDKYF